MVVRISEKLAMLSDYWSPKVVAQLNDYHLKVVKIQGDFIWHSHPETDEAFLVISGELRMDFRDRSVRLREGELLVVPKGVEHKPFAASECHVLLIEPAGTLNTGDRGGERTAAHSEWI